MTIKKQSNRELEEFESEPVKELPEKAIGFPSEYSLAEFGFGSYECYSYKNELKIRERDVDGEEIWNAALKKTDPQSPELKFKAVSSTDPEYNGWGFDIQRIAPEEYCLHVMPVDLRAPMVARAAGEEQVYIWIDDSGFPIDAIPAKASPELESILMADVGFEIAAAPQPQNQYSVRDDLDATLLHFPK